VAIKKIKKAAPAETDSIPVVDPLYLDPDNRYRLPDNKFWQWKALTHELELNLLKHLKAKEDFENLVQKTPHLVELRGQMAAAKAENARLAREMQAFQNEIAEATKLDLKHCVIDDKTGVITYFVPETQEQPPQDKPQS
jgi:hypothetical protein